MQFNIVPTNVPHMTQAPCCAYNIQFHKTIIHQTYKTTKIHSVKYSVTDKVRRLEKIISKGVDICKIII